MSGSDRQFSKLPRNKDTNLPFHHDPLAVVRIVDLIIVTYPAIVTSPVME